MVQVSPLDSLLIQKLAEKTPSHGIFIDALLTALPAIIVFSLGVVAQIMGRKYLKNKESANLYSLFLASLKQLMSPIESQVEKLRGYTSSLKDPKEPTAILSFVPAASVDVLSRLSVADLYKAMMRGDGKFKENRLQHFTKAFEILIFIRSFFDTTRSQNDRFGKEHRKWNEQWNSNLGKYKNDLFASIRDSGNFPKDSLLSTLNTIYKKWTKQNDYTTHYIAHEEMIKPSIDYLRANYADPRAIFLFTSLEQCRDAYNAIAMHKKIISDLIDESADKLEGRKAELERIIDFFSLHRPKWWQ